MARFIRAGRRCREAEAVKRVRRLWLSLLLLGATIGSAEAQTEKGPRVNPAEYEGWRQYSVQCARCHGQDVLGNPVAADLLVYLGPGGPINSPEKFVQVVSEGRKDRGMPAFKQIMSPEQIQSVYAYVKGRADKRIPPGRPVKPSR
jgi:mono/diheme cytochrome c family protein